jgi:hypothetical protein
MKATEGRERETSISTGGYHDILENCDFNIYFRAFSGLLLQADNEICEGKVTTSLILPKKRG